MVWDGNERRDFNWREVTDHMAETNIKLKSLIDKVSIQNGRVSKLENWRWFVMGVCAVITLLISVIKR